MSLLCDMNSILVMTDSSSTMKHPPYCQMIWSIWGHTDLILILLYTMLASLSSSLAPSFSCTSPRWKQHVGPQMQRRHLSLFEKFPFALSSCVPALCPSSSLRCLRNCANSAPFELLILVNFQILIFRCLETYQAKNDLAQKMYGIGSPDTFAGRFFFSRVACLPVDSSGPY